MTLITMYEDLSESMVAFKSHDLDILERNGRANCDLRDLFGPGQCFQVPG